MSWLFILPLCSGSGRVTFNNQRSYLKAVSAAFVEIKTPKFTKKVGEVKLQNLLNFVPRQHGAGVQSSTQCCCKCYSVVIVDVKCCQCTNQRDVHGFEKKPLGALGVLMCLSLESCDLSVPVNLTYSISAEHTEYLQLYWISSWSFAARAEYLQHSSAVECVI